MDDLFVTTGTDLIEILKNNGFSRDGNDEGTKDPPLTGKSSSKLSLSLESGL